MIDWEAMGNIVKVADDAIDERELADWKAVLTDRGLPDNLKIVFPEGSGVRFMRDLASDPDEQLFALFRSIPNKEGSGSYLVKGVSNAQTEPDFKSIYERFGWRTLIYVMLVFGQSPIPSREGSSRYQINWQIPTLFYSPEPDAFPPELFRRIYLITLFELVAKTLRFGMTWSETRASRLFESIPGVVCLISSELVYEANQEFKTWFAQELGAGEAIQLSNLVSPALHEWIRETVLEDPVDHPGSHSKIDWIQRRDGRMIRAEVEIQPFKPFEFISLHESMNLGYQGLNTKNADDLLHLMFIRDVSVQFEAERVMQEIELARKVQMRLLPSKIPWTDRFDVAADCQPAGDIGGDLFDVTLLADGRLAVFTCDATGHGIDSAMLAALVSGAYRATVMKDPSPESVIEAMDLALRKTHQTGFVTAAYLLLDPASQQMNLALAGHYPAIHVRENSVLRYPQAPSSLPLGVNLPASYHFSRTAFSRGDVITLLSDGFLEARNPEEDGFDPKIEGILSSAKKQGAAGILHALFKSFKRFRNGIPAEDDLTAVIVKIK